MTGFRVDPDAVDRHADQVDAVSADVGNGAAAEVTGAGRADFGVLIGNTLGFGIRALADSCAHSLQSTAKALTATAEQLHGDAAVYRSTEQTNHTVVHGTVRAI